MSCPPCWRRWLAASLLAVLFSIAVPARASDAALLGRRARVRGEYGFAIKAFKQAHAARASKELLLAIADAHHQRFLVAAAGYDRLQAIAFYQSFLASSPSAGPAESARGAVAELRANPSRVSREQIERAAEAEASETWLAVSSPGQGATVVVDGDAARSLPAFVEVTAGPHDLALRLAGHETHRRRVDVARGEVVVVQARMVPIDGTVIVDASSGAQVFIDGRFVGPAPARAKVAPGPRVVRVAQVGHEPHVAKLVVEPGKEQTLAVELDLTWQRVGAAVVLASAAASLVAAIALGAVSSVHASEAAEATTLDARMASQASADDFGLSAGVTVGIGLGLFAVGGALFTFDEPPDALRSGNFGRAAITWSGEF